MNPKMCRRSIVYQQTRSIVFSGRPENLFNLNHVSASYCPKTVLFTSQNAVRVNPKIFGSMKQSNSTRTRKCAKHLFLQAKTRLSIFGSTRTSSHFAYTTIFGVAKLCIFVACFIRFGQGRQCAGPSEFVAIAHTTA